MPEGITFYSCAVICSTAGNTLGRDHVSVTASAERPASPPDVGMREEIIGATIQQTLRNIGQNLTR